MTELRGILIIAAFLGIVIAIGVLEQGVQPEEGAVEVLGTSAEGHVVKKTYLKGEWHTFVEAPR